MKHIYTTIVVLSLLLFSCRPEINDNYEREAIALNDQAIETMHSDPDSALSLLDKAIENDKDYYIAYNNKVAVYCSKGDYNNAIKAVEQVLNGKPDLAEAVTMLGMLYDYTGQQDNAREQYLKALALFENRLAQSSKNKQANRVNRAHALLLLGDKEGQKEVQELLKVNPNDFTVQMLVDFDKEKYLNDVLGKKQ